MITTLDDFIREYQKICSMGWIKTHRAGPTGIGKTLEDLLGIQPCNIFLTILRFFGCEIQKKCGIQSEGQQEGETLMK